MQHIKNRIQQRQGRFTSRMRRSLLVVLALFLVVGIAFPVAAQSFEQKIQELESKVEANGQSVDELKNKANDINAQIQALSSQIASTQSQITISQQQHDDLTKQIEEAQKELERQREVLGKNIKAMYLEGEISTVEMLASSKNISEYLDRQQYRNAVKDKVAETVKKIGDLKKELDEKRVQVAKLLEDQKRMYADLDSKKASADALLSQTNADKAQFEQTIQDQQGEITRLRAEQAAANRSRLGGAASYAGTSSYPWANEGFPCSGGDPWGMCYRQCVSYTAWKVASTGRDMPYWGGRGNAKNWPNNARSAGIPVDGNPKAGDVAISTGGPYGHAMYVERVMGNGQIYVSQYNYEERGLYSEMLISTAGLEFIHF